MRPITAIPETVCRGLKAVLADIDDTLTTEGRLTAQAYSALHRLSEAGFLVVAVTGRPGGWCDHIARMWPVNAVVGENGAFWFWYDAGAGRLRRRFLQDGETREANRARLSRLREEILAKVPGAGIASDQLYRENDLAIDYCEDVAPLAPEEVERIVAIAGAAGASVKVSSIHVNIWFGGYDKLTTTHRMMRELFGLDVERGDETVLFVGDSPNDSPMFWAFRHSVGVANVRRFLEQLEHRPAYVTTRPAGAGFAELVDCLLAKRAGRDSAAAAARRTGANC